MGSVPPLHGHFFFNFLFIFIYFWLCWVFVSVRGLSLVAASGGHSSSRCAGLSLLRPPLLRSTGSRRAGSVIVAHGPSCSAACGIFPDQGSNPCPVHWQADSQPLRHQGSPAWAFIEHLLHASTLPDKQDRYAPCPRGTYKWTRKRQVSRQCSAVSPKSPDHHNKLTGLWGYLKSLSVTQHYPPSAGYNMNYWLEIVSISTLDHTAFLSRIYLESCFFQHLLW